MRLWISIARAKANRQECVYHNGRTPKRKQKSRHTHSVGSVAHQNLFCLDEGWQRILHRMR